MVSAFIDQYAYSKNDGVKKMLAAFPPNDGEPKSFVEFLRYLKEVPDAERDSHFQTQSFFKYSDGIVTTKNHKYRWLNSKPDNLFGVRYCGDLTRFNDHMVQAYRKIFRGNGSAQRLAETKIFATEKLNSLYFGEKDFADAALLTTEELDQLTFAPKPQDFFNSEAARDLVHEIYAQDFAHFGYEMNEIPQKKASSEVQYVPSDMDWQMYIRLNPDLPPEDVYNERTVLRHYLEFGRFEDHPRAYKIEAPEGFDWQRYLSLYADLRVAGIDNESAAIEHYISYGIREEREI